MHFKNSKVKTSLLLVLAVIIVLLSLSLSLYFDYNAYREIGANFLEVFFTDLQAKIYAQAISFILVFTVIYLSFDRVKKNLIKIDSLFEFLNNKLLILIASLLLSFLASSIIRTAVYERLLLFLNSTDFNITDPIFLKDIGYYVFQRPFLDSLLDSLISIFILVFISVLVSYIFLYLRLGITNITELFKIKSIAIHNIFNLTLIIIAKIVSFGIKAEEMLYSTTSTFVGAGFSEVNIWKIYYAIMPYILIAILIFAGIFIYKGKVKLSFLSFLAYPVIYGIFLITVIFTDTLIVKPKEVSIQAPYIANNIKYTKMAYDLTDISSKIFDVDYDLTPEKLEEEKNVLSSTRIIDYESSVSALNQIQGIRNYYKFNDIDIVKYDLGGVPTAIALAPREFNKDNIDQTAKTFINEKLRFTHGYGVTGLLVNQVTGEGLPELVIKDIPPVSLDLALNITEPRIYFGELTNDYVVVNSDYKELDYSSGDEDVEYSYEGKAGIKMNLLNKLLYSFHYGDFELLISSYVHSDSRLLINRNVIKRVEKVAPFMMVDNDPYILIDSEGRIKWIVNLYTTTDRFPYSQSTIVSGEKINYIRESAKAVVDAFDGTVKFYITDDKDPIINSYKKIYPSFFEKETLPDDLKEHLQYPEKMFRVQAEILKRYHTENTGIFYNKTDMWDISKEKYQSEDKYVSPYYSMMSLFDDTEELTLLIPYTMTNKQNLVAWLAVSCDKDNYGKKILYTFPKGESIYGIMQIENKIDNDPEISREMTLWGQGGSTVIRGNMLVIPISNSLLYIEPVYISSGSQTSLPELKRVILAYKDKIVMEESFEKALYKMFGFKLTPNADILSNNDFKDNETENIPPVSSDNPLIVELFDSIKKAMEEGNWQDFGNNFSLLEEEIEKLR